MKAASSSQLKGKDEQKTARLVPGSVATVREAGGRRGVARRSGQCHGKSRAGSLGVTLGTGLVFVSHLELLGQHRDFRNSGPV